MSPRSMEDRESARAAYERACDHDRHGREVQAVPEYEEALARGLDGEERRGALVGLGSSLRNVGRTSEAVSLLRNATEEFPEDVSLRAFLGLALYSAGEQRSAVAELLDIVIRHAPVDEYRRALSHYRDALARGDDESAILP